MQCHLMLLYLFHEKYLVARMDCDSLRNQKTGIQMVWHDHPTIMAVGVVDGTSEAIFRTLMSLGPSRSEWDYSFYRGSIVEHLDGHTDIVHIQLYNHWLPWGLTRRDMLLRRYWIFDGLAVLGGSLV